MWRWDIWCQKDLFNYLFNIIFSNYSTSNSNSRRRDHYKIFIHALAFIAHVYQYDTFPFQDAIIEHICQSININSDFNSNDDINIYLAFLQLFVNQKYNDVKAFLNEICFLETKIE